jgi:hypothetical protein
MQESERKKLKLKMKAWPYFLALLLLLLFVALAMNYSVWVKWFVSAPIVVTLNHPNANAVVNNYTTTFNWTGTGGNGKDRKSVV